MKNQDLKMVSAGVGAAGVVSTAQSKATESTTPLYFEIETLGNSNLKALKHWSFGIIRDSKRAFGIFRTLLSQLQERNPKKHLPYSVELL